MSKIDTREAALIDRLIKVLESDNPTTEELTITLEITPEDILERFPDRIYDLREKIVDTKIIFGEPDEEEADEESYIDTEEGDDYEEGDPPWQDEAEEEQIQQGWTPKRAGD